MILVSHIQQCETLWQTGQTIPWSFYSETLCSVYFTHWWLHLLKLWQLIHVRYDPAHVAAHKRGAFILVWRPGGNISDDGMDCCSSLWWNWLGQSQVVQHDCVFHLCAVLWNSRYAVLCQWGADTSTVEHHYPLSPSSPSAAPLLCRGFPLRTCAGYYWQVFPIDLEIKPNNHFRAVHLPHLPRSHKSEWIQRSSALVTILIFFGSFHLALLSLPLSFMCSAISSFLICFHLCSLAFFLCKTLLSYPVFVILPVIKEDLSFNHLSRSERTYRSVTSLELFIWLYHSY